jgi:hypothetical protein
MSQADDSSGDSMHPSLLMRVAVRGTDDEIGRLKEKLDDWLEECQTLAECGDGRDDGIAYSGLLAFYPRPDDKGGAGE